MPSFTSDPKKPGAKKDRSYAQIALLGAVPGILVAAPLIGYFIGKWADGKLDSEGRLSIVGVILGFVAAGFEIYRLAKKSEELGKDENSK